MVSVFAIGRPLDPGRSATPALDSKSAFGIMLFMTDQLVHPDHEPDVHRTVPLPDGTSCCYRPTDVHYRIAVTVDGFEFDGRTFARRVDVLDYIDETHEPQPQPAPQPLLGRVGRQPSAGRGPLPVYDDLMRSVFGR